MLRKAVGLLALLSMAACAEVKTSAVPTSAAASPYQGVVEVRATTIPPGARELGIVEAHGPNTSIDKLVPELEKRVARMGGNFAKIDQIKTRYQMTTEPETYSYECGKVTCTGTRTVPIEIATTSVLGRAFLVKEPQR